MNYIGQHLSDAIQDLDAANTKYIVQYTSPARKHFCLDSDTFYVIQQRLNADGTICLIAAAKMGKEVFLNHGIQNY
ncbi:hypothetical protein [Methylomusa anaerophila]|uniref:Uncharacterized protein n=1 Tax=Methylomusa anaerophila TaxID=1930071 RepID=A0A348AQ02_9FIRM|nr:hypothetical protein [Methylomusa anaerophila]BBB93150.1 hypothetical protein MAMMFC1_03859 [Methylomusa anaerophila]